MRMRIRSVVGGVAVAVGMLLVTGMAWAQEGTNQATGAGVKPNLVDLQLGVGRPSMSASGEKIRFSTSTTLTCEECIFLDTYDPSHTTDAPVGSPWVMGPVFSNGVLTAGRPYLVTVSGDVSYWAKSWWDGATTVTGTPKASPQYPSPGTTNGETGFDFEDVFAIPYFFNSFPIPAHVPAAGFSTDGGATFFDSVPLGGQTYHSNHIYQYVVIGEGHKFGVERTDGGPTSDNYGQFKICIQYLQPCSNGCDGGQGADGETGGHS